MSASFTASPLIPGDIFANAARFAAGAAERIAPIAEPSRRAEVLEDLWREAGELGWPGIAIPQAQGGAGAELEDLFALIEGAGQAALPLPLASVSGVLPAMIPEEVSADILPAITSGRWSVAPALAAVQRSMGEAGVHAVPSGGDLHLSGRLISVEAPPSITHVLHDATVAGEPGLLLLPIGRAYVASRRFERLDGRPTVDLTLDGVRLPASALLARGASVARAGARAEALGILLVCIEAVAAMGSLVEGTIRYLSTRVQFGETLSRFQVLRHAAVDLYVRLVGARALVSRLIGSQRGHRPATFEPGRELSVAKLHLGRVSREVAQKAIQLHGGMGLAEELPASRLTRRLLMVEFEFGDRPYHMSALTDVSNDTEQRSGAKQRAGRPMPDDAGGDTAFRDEVRDFCLTRCPADIRELVARDGKLGRDAWSRWQRILFDRGWAAPNWPREFGGTGWDLRRQHIFEETLGECDCPPQYHHGLRHLGPVLIEFGSPEQHARFLPGILDGSVWWCQGYSEPGAGSDLAALKTQARRDGDDYVVSGQKMWTSHAHEADMMYALVRTSQEAKKQQGISLLLIPLDSPGVTVKPIRTIDGWHHVNEVFLDDVRVSQRNRVGAEGQGWSYGKFLLDRERLANASVGPFIRRLARTRRLIADTLAKTESAPRRSALEQRLLSAEAEAMALRALSREAVEAIVRGDPLSSTASVVKLVSAALMQRLDEIAIDATGHGLVGRFWPTDGGAPLEGIEWLQNYLYGRVRTIYAGSDEVQKNALARVLFGH